MSDRKFISDRQGFTLIEILVIVAIVGLLVSAILVSINSARTKAKNNSFKTTAKSIQNGLAMCCVNTGTILSRNVGQPICAGGGNYPDEASVGSITSGSCDGNSFDKTIIPGTKNSGDCTSARITDSHIVYEGAGC